VVSSAVECHWGEDFEVSSGVEFQDICGQNENPSEQFLGLSLVRRIVHLRSNDALS